MSVRHPVRVFVLVVLAIAVALSAAFVRQGVNPLLDYGYVLAGFIAAVAVALGVGAPPPVREGIRWTAVTAIGLTAIGAFLAAGGKSALTNPSQAFAWLGAMVGAMFAIVPLVLMAVVVLASRVPKEPAARTSTTTSPETKRRWRIVVALCAAAALMFVGVGVVQRRAAREARTNAFRERWASDPPAHVADEQWAGNEGGIVGAAFSADGRLLATIGGGGGGGTTAKLWDAGQGAELAHVAVAKVHAALANVTFDETSTTLELRFIDGTGARLSVPTLQALPPPAAGPVSPGLTRAQREWRAPDGRTVAWDGSRVTLSDATGVAVCVADLAGDRHDGWRVPGVAFSSRGAAAAFGGTVRVLDAACASDGAIVAPAGAGVVAWSADGARLFVGGNRSGWVVDPVGGAPPLKLRARAEKLEEWAVFRGQFDR